MPNYIINVSAEIPYKVEKEFRASGWDFHVAVARAIKKYREYLREERGKAKQLKTITIKATRI